MSVFSNNLLLGAGGQSTGPEPFDPTLIPNSVWLDGSADFLSVALGAKTRTKAVIGTWFQKTGFTTADSTIFSKRSGGTAEFGMRMQDQASKQGLISIYDFDSAGSGQYAAESSGMVLRDIGWYHIMISIDTTAVAGSRLRYFINGIDRTDTLTVSPDYALNDNPSITGGSGGETQWGIGSGGSSQFAPIYLAQSFMLDDDSIQNNDVGVPDILDTFTYGTNGSQFVPKANADIASLASSAGGDSFCLDYANSSDLGNDISSNNNDFSPTSMAAANQRTNTPSKVFPIMNPLNDIATVVLSEGNTRVNAQANASIRSTLFASAGKKYAEITVTAIGNSYLGVAINGTNPTSFAATGAVACQQGGDVYVSSSSPSGKKCPAYTTNDVLGILIDVEANKFWVSKNGTFHSMDRDPTITLTATQVLAGTGGFDLTELGSDGSYGIHVGNSDGSAQNVSVNFGQASFSHTPPDGYVDWASDNLAAPDFQGKDFFDATLYEGNGTSQRVGDFVPFTDALAVANSAMFQHDDARAFSRRVGTPSSSGGKKGTWSVWYKTSVIDTDNVLFDTGTTATNRFSLQMDASGQITFLHGSATILKTNADLKGGGFWRNLVLRVDTGVSAAADRALMYIDGVLVTSFATDGRASLTKDSELGYMDSGATQFVGSFNGVSANQWDGYFAETVFLDNQFLSASSFGQLDTSTNKWVPKAVTGLTFGDQGFYLDFENSPVNVALGKTGLKSDDLGTGAVSLLTDGTQFGSFNAGSNLIFQNSNVTTKSWWGVDFGSGQTKTIKSATLFGNQPGDGSAAGFIFTSGAVTWTLFGSNSAVATSSNDLSGTTTLGTAAVADGVTKGATVVIDATSNSAAFRFYYVQMNTTLSTRRLLGEIQLYETDGGGIAKDSSGKNNDFAALGAWAATDQFIDTPSKNFATFDTDNNQSNVLTNGGTRLSPGGSGWKSTAATLRGLTSGKFYFEFTPETANSNIIVGIGSPPFVTTGGTLPGSNFNEYSYYFADGNIFNNGVFTAYGSAVGAGVVVGVAIDLDNNKIFFARNNTFEDSGNPVTGANAAFTITGNISYDIVVGMTNSVTTADNIVNFGGQSAFAFTPPTGFVAVNQDNLDDTQSKITAFAWIKNRDATDNHMLFDRVRGVGKDWHSNEAEAEVFNANTLTRFLQRGVQVANNAEVNTVNESFVMWQWLMGDAATTGTLNEEGSLDSTVITAASEHFSVGTYTGNATDNATVGHGLGGIPEMIIVKTLADAVHGVCWHKDAAGSPSANTQGDWARDTAFAVNSAKFGGTNSTLPSSTVFKMGNNAEINPSSKSVLFYAFRSIPGVCKVGSYTGNGAADGPFINTGFLPRWIMIKQTATASRQWNILDTARYPFNAANPLVLLANTTAAGAAHIGNFDFLADGFKVRDTADNVNTSGNNYTYVTMADIGGNGTLPPVYSR